MKSNGDSTHMLAHLSDKFHYIVSLFSENSLSNFAKYNNYIIFQTLLLFSCRKHQNWSIMDIQGAIIRVLEYRIVRVPCSGDTEVGDSVVLVIEGFEHVGSDGSSVFGDPRYVPINPAIRTSLQRPAPPSPLKKEGGKSQDYSFTQSLDPNDLLFLESTCTQTFQRQFTTFPQVISDSDWRIPADQVKILEGIQLIQIESFEYENVSDVDLSDVELLDDEHEKAKRTKVIFPVSQSSEVTHSHTQNSQTIQSNSPLKSQPLMTQVPITQVPLTQMPMTQAPFTQAPMTQIPESQVPSSQTTLSPLKSVASSTQTAPLSQPVIFPETQGTNSNSSILFATQTSPIRNSNLMNSPVASSSPIKPEDVINEINNATSPIKNMNNPANNTNVSSPVKDNAAIKNTTSSPVRNNPTSSPMKEVSTPIRTAVYSRTVVPESPLVNEVIKTTIETADIPSSPINSPVKKPVVVEISTPKTSEPPVIEFPDYSSW